ncbi:hypothetical protein ACVGVM_10635 [Pseudonocardia bannensis]|uniref:Uncharacterized protein n=1 Tax=Pseudonocardia bannensis TaxID=630973 RepID=A0A848DRV6_9PSEU|nr:hypothetical protein [Pseudonocardia bannensis]NMH95255.1 hypothetical protein [Pseudonocardia bannensis]
MTRTVTQPVTRAAGGAKRAAEGATSGATSEVAREAARRAMAEAGRRVLGAVVDRAVSRVDDVADRLDDVVENRGTGVREALTGRPGRRDAADRKKTAGGGPGLTAQMGAAFSTVVYRALQLLQSIQRMALQLLEALQRLVRRPAKGEPDAEADSGVQPDRETEKEPPDETDEAGADEQERAEAPRPRSGPRAVAATPRRSGRPAQARGDETGRRGGRPTRTGRSG